MGGIYGKLVQIGLLYDTGRETGSIPKIPNLQVTRWTKGLLRARDRERHAFCLKANLESVSSLAIHSRLGIVHGIEIIHRDEASTSEFLGTTHEYDQVERFSINGDIQSICAHYKVCKWQGICLVGLYIATSEQRIEFGDVKRFPQIFLKFCDVSQTPLCALVLRLSTDR